MQTLSQKILVKVGKSSTIKFNNAKVYRAITIGELSTLHKLNPDASIVVIENIKAADYEKLNAFITEFENDNSQNKVFFYLPDNDDTTSGIADELDKDIYLNLRDLQDAIERIYGISVSTDMDRIKSSITEVDLDDDPFDSSFDDSLDTIQATQKQKEHKILPSIDNKDDLNEFDTSIIEEEERRVAEETRIKLEKEVSDKTETSSKIETDSKADGEAKGENKSEAEGPEDVASTVHGDTSDTEVKPDSTLNGKNSEQVVTDSKTAELLNRTQKELEIANQNIKKHADEISELKRKLTEALNKSVELNKLIKALEGEKSIISDRLLKFTQSEVMEEPITLTEYKQLQDKVAQLTAQAGAGADLSDRLDEALRKLKAAEDQSETSNKSIDDYKKRLQDSASRLIEARKLVEQHEETIKKLEQQISEASQKENLSAETEAELEALKASKAELGAKVDELQADITELSNRNEELLGKLQSEVNARLLLTNVIYDALAEIQHNDSIMNSNSSMVASLNETISSLEMLNTQNSNRIKDYEQKMITFSSIELSLRTVQDERDRLQNENASQAAKITELEGKLTSFGTLENTVKAMRADNDRISKESADRMTQIVALQGQITIKDARIHELEAQTSTIDARLEMARNFSKSEVDRAKAEAADIQAKLNALQAQYDVKNGQYEQLVKSCGMNENGVTSLLETSKTIEAYNSTLIEQVNTLKEKLEKAESEAKIAKQTAEALETSNRSMRVNMESMSSLIGGEKGQSIKPIRYSSRGMIIPVFGCGSYGITTTAMSIAYKLAAQSKVLYLDFDMVTPKADGWFRISPFIKNVEGAQMLGGRCTGLGLFVERQNQFFMNNYQQIISKPLSTKNGCIDYMSGFYVRPDTNKLIAADFSSLMNFLGNMYTYIVIDFGKLGCSEVSDQLIKAFVDVSYRSVIVTTSDKFETSSFRRKLSECKITMSKVCWLLNMCTSTKLEEPTKKAISGIGYEMIPFNTGIYGKKMNFMNDSLTRDKMTRFMEEQILRR